MLLLRRLGVNVQAEQAKGASAPFANVDGGSEATTACFSRLLLLSLALQPGGGLFLSVLCAFAVIPKENVKSAKLLSNVKGVDE